MPIQAKEVQSPAQLQEEVNEVLASEGHYSVATSMLTNTAIEQASKKWTMPIREWNMAMNQLIIIHGERLTASTYEINIKRQDNDYIFQNRKLSLF